MDEAVLKKVLACPSLPSLPSVAVQVLELTSVENVKIEELADAIQYDQALSAKILRTVNSSYYGLRKRCTSIHKALLLLGIRPVKALVLGFSLVSAVEEEDAPAAFDYRAYWRRALYAAVGAKSLARELGSVDPDEAFLAGLLQDIGMVALHQTLGAEYDAVLRTAGPHHQNLCRAELEMLDIQHTEVGALLAEAWHFPSTLVVPIRYHERPTAAPATCAELVRCVGLGNLVHDALTHDDPTPALRRLYERGRQWFNLTPSSLDDHVREIAEAGSEVSRLFSLDTGSATDANAMLERAEERLLEMTRHAPRGSYAAEELAKHHDGAGEHDPLTGAAGAGGFAQAVHGAFDEARQGGAPLTIVHTAVDAFETLTEKHGTVARDELVIGLVALLHKHFEHMGAVVCRLQPGVFSVVLPRLEHAHAIIAADTFRTALSGSVPRWLPALGDDRVTASVGVVTLDSNSMPAFETPEQLMEAGELALQTARNKGGDTVSRYSPPARAA